jgi:hypothetical protein
MIYIIVARYPRKAAGKPPRPTTALWWMLLQIVVNFQISLLLARLVFVSASDIKHVNE